MFSRFCHGFSQGAGTDEAVLIEILCPRLNNEIRSIKAHYEHGSAPAQYLSLTI